jgi:hypothetical protein
MTDDLNTLWRAEEYAENLRLREELDSMRMRTEAAENHCEALSRSDRNSAAENSELEDRIEAAEENLREAQTCNIILARERDELKAVVRTVARQKIEDIRLAQNSREIALGVLQHLANIARIAMKGESDALQEL